LNGNLFPTRTEANRRIVPDFKAVIMHHAGHFPMAEKPEEFNQAIDEFLASRA